MKNPRPYTSGGIPYIVAFRYRNGDTRRRLLARLRRLAALGELNTSRATRSSKIFFKGCTFGGTVALLNSIRDTEEVFSEAQRVALRSAGRSDLSQEIIEKFTREVGVVNLGCIEATGIGEFNIQMAPSNCFPEFGADIWLKREVSLVGGSISVTRPGGKDYRTAGLQIKQMLELE